MGEDRGLGKEVAHWWDRTSTGLLQRRPGA
jgi:hypothetical protein